MYTAELVKGKTYDVMGCIFKSGEEPKPIERSVYDYLIGNTHFSLTRDEVSPPKDEGAAPNAETKEYTAASLKKLNADEQKAIISELGGDLESVNNEDERIALIFDLEEAQKVEKE